MAAAGDAKDGEASGEAALQLLREPDAARLSLLKVMDLKGLGLTTLPDALGQCSQLQRLDVGNNPLQDLPEIVASMPCLEIFFASGAQFTEVPAVLRRCAQLRMVGLSKNRLASLDGERLPEGLTWLIAAGNQISSLPNIARVRHVRKLMLSHNQLTCEALAPAAGIADLEMIRVAANRLEAFPEALLRHPRLSWVAVGGNPFAEATMQERLATAPPAIDFSEVSLGAALGKGAGATVYSAGWRGRDVAVKLWEAEQFSDGTARGEWAVNRVAGHPGHPSLVGVLGTFEEPRPGMVLEKIEGASAAAGAPTFAPFTVTRDVLPKHGRAGPRFTASAALAVARTVAVACEYLHSRGILHGDVYLHNTLVVLDGPLEASAVRDVRLSDFGAAAAVDEPRFFKLEARSFGWMLQDLLDILEAPAAGGGEEAAAGTLALLRGLRERCAREAVDELPAFTELAAALRSDAPAPAL